MSTDFFFVKNEVFTGQCERNGSFEFEIEVGRDVGDVSKLLSTGSMPEFVKLTSGAYYRGDPNEFCQKVQFNGNTVENFFYLGCNDPPCDKDKDKVNLPPLERWHHQAGRIKTEWINFAKFDPDNGVLVPGKNTVRIVLEEKNEDGYCGVILYRNLHQDQEALGRRTETHDDSCLAWDDYFAIDLDMLPSLPILLLHGVKSSSAIWENFWAPELRSLGIPHDATLDMGETSKIQDNAKLIGPRVQALKDRYGVKKVKLACHSKGGIEARHFVSPDNSFGAIATGGLKTDVQSIIQLATPNKGTRMANRLFRVATGVAGPAFLIAAVIGGTAGDLGGLFVSITRKVEVHVLA